ncbi:sulfatase-like hydrolase/transferase [soil metagenome]
MKTFILTVWLTVVALSVTGQADDQKPNFVIILADDMGYSDASCYGNTRYQTPHIDALAAEGLRLTDFHSSGPVCSPTRAGLLTGRYQQRAGIPGVIFAGFDQNRHHGLQPEEITFAERLKDAGYTSALCGKWHLGYEEKYNPTHQGFDLFRGFVSGNIDYVSHFDRMGVHDWWHDLRRVQEAGYSTQLITEHAVRFIEANSERPFCLYVAHEAPHSPYQGPSDPAIRVSGKVMPERYPEGQIERAYREMMEELDASVGALVETLKRLDLEENTLVFFFSDNGGNANGNNGPLRGFKGSVWEGGHRVPAIARWPGRIAEGTTNDEPAISLDLLPTMLELAGASVPEGHTLDGLSLAPVLLDQQTLRDRALFWEYNGRQAVRQGPWKLVVGERGLGGGPESIGLFHLGDDLAEQINRAGDEPDRVRELQQTLRAWQADVAEGATRQPDREDRP